MADAAPRSEKLTDLLTGQIGRSVKQFLGATGLSYLAQATAPAMAFVGMPVLMLVDYAIERRREHGQYRAMRDSYKKEISVLTGIPEAELTTGRTQEVLEAHLGDPHFAVFNEMIGIDHTIHRNRLIQSALGALFTTFGVCVAAAFGAAPLSMAFFIGTASTLLTGVLDTVLSMKPQEMVENTVSLQVRELTQQSKQQQVQPAKVFQTYLSAQPELRAHLEQQFGKPYVSMTFAEKQRAVAMYDAPLHLQEIAARINDGTIRPTEMAWIAYGQRSGVADKAGLAQPAAQPANEVPARGEFVARLQQAQAQDMPLARA